MKLILCGDQYHLRKILEMKKYIKEFEIIPGITNFPVASTIFVLSFISKFVPICAYFFNKG